jgi:hypothetical protein
VCGGGVRAGVGDGTCGDADPDPASSLDRVMQQGPPMRSIIRVSFLLAGVILAATALAAAPAHAQCPTENIKKFFTAPPAADSSVDETLQYSLLRPAQPSEIGTPAVWDVKGGTGARFCKVDVLGVVYVIKVFPSADLCRAEVENYRKELNNQKSLMTLRSYGLTPGSAMYLMPLFLRDVFTPFYGAYVENGQCVFTVSKLAAGRTMTDVLADTAKNPFHPQFREHAVRAWGSTLGALHAKTFIYPGLKDEGALAAWRAINPPDVAAGNMVFDDTRRQVTIIDWSARTEVNIKAMLDSVFSQLEVFAFSSSPVMPGIPDLTKYELTDANVAILTEATTLALAFWSEYFQALATTTGLPLDTPGFKGPLFNAIYSYRIRDANKQLRKACEKVAPQCPAAATTRPAVVQLCGNCQLL